MVGIYALYYMIVALLVDIFDKELHHLWYLVLHA